MKTHSQPRALLAALPALVILVVSTCFAQTSPVNPYDSQLQLLIEKLASANAPAKVVLLNRVEALREYVDDPSRVTTALKSVANNRDEAPLVRADANYRLARIAVHEGRLQDAAKIADALGFVRDWTMASGGCESQKASAHATALKTTPMAVVSIRNVSPTVCLSTAIFSPNNQSANNQNVAFRFGANAATALRLNGNTLSAPSSQQVPEFAFDQRSIGAQLHAGWNTVAIELIGMADAGKFALRVTTTEGASDLNLIADSSRVVNFHEKGSTATKVDATDLLTLAEKQAAEKKSPEAVDTVAALEQIRGISAPQKADIPGAPVNSQQLEGAEASSIWLKREMALRYERAGDDGRAASLLNKVWKTSFDDVRVRAALERLAERRSDTAALEMLAQTAAQLDPSDAQDDLQAQPEAGTAVASTEPGGHLRYASLVLPKNNSPRQRALAAGSAARNRLDDEADAPYLMNAARLAVDARIVAPREVSNVVVLSDVTVERVRENGQSTAHTQQVFYISNDRGARDYSTRSVQFSNATQKLIVYSARVFKADGRIVHADEQGDNVVADTSMSMYYDTRSRVLRFPGLQRGDVMELEYRLVPRNGVNVYGNYFGTLVAFQTGLPQRLRRYVLIAPNQRPLNVVEQRMPAKTVITRTATETTYRWDALRIQPLLTEPRGPALTETSPYISASTFASWEQFGRWYTAMVTPQFTLNDELREALKGLTGGSLTELEKIHAIHEFVLRNTNYIAMEFGVHSYKPYPVAQVYARRFGDCKDKAGLTIALLRAAGIDADMGLVRTRKLGDVSDRSITIAVFNHALAYVPKYDLWLDGTADYAGLHELPLDDQGAMAVTVDRNGKATQRRIPTTLPWQNYTHRMVQAQIQTDGKIVFDGSAYTRGEDAPGLRREYELADRQRDTVRANLAQIYPSVQVDTVHVDGAHDLEHDIKVRFSGSLNTFAGQKTITLAPSWLPHKYLDALAPLESRTQPLQLPAPWTTEEELHFALPEGARFQSVPEDQQFETNFGTAAIRYERRARELVVTTSVQFRQVHVESAEYKAFRDFCSQVENAFRTEIKIRLAS